MTPAEVDELVTESPYLYHMAMRDSWPLIERHGLLPTVRLLELFEIRDTEAVALLCNRRPESVEIEHHLHGKATVRDQFPMDEKGLLRCLLDGLTPLDWYTLLNERVFFWLTEERLERLLCAGSYRASEHIVLKIPTKSIIENYGNRIELSPMNSGCTKPYPHPRGRGTFLPINLYPYSDWKKKRKPGERVVELTVIGGIPDIKKYVEEISIRACGAQVGPTNIR